MRNNNKRRSPRSQPAGVIAETCKISEETPSENDNQDINPSPNDDTIHPPTEPSDKMAKMQTIESGEVPVGPIFESWKTDMFGNEGGGHSDDVDEVSANVSGENKTDTSAWPIAEGPPLEKGFPNSKQNEENTFPLLPSDEKFNCSAEDLLKGWLQQGKELQENWTASFSESENFELYCPTRIDTLLQQAKELEDHLRSQKELLRQKLVALSSTLQNT